MLQISCHFLISFLLILSITQTSASYHQCSSNLIRRTAEVRAGFWLPQSNSYFTVSQINTSLYTHIYYSLSLGDAGLLQPFPPESELALLATFSATLKSQNPYLKTILSVSTAGQKSNSSAIFASMIDIAPIRAAFINSTIELARINGFDGLDLAWQFPSSRADMGNLELLLQEWRDRINGEATANSSSTPLLLTATVYFSDHLFDGPADNLDYPVEAMSENLDWVNAQCFSYHKNDMVTASDAPLYDVDSHFSTSYGITSWLDAGLPPCKLVMGIPLYGRSWFLKNKAKNGIGAQAVADGPRQKWSNRAGIMAFFEIEEFLTNVTAEFTYDNRTVSSFFHESSIWVSFDSPGVVEEKIAYASQRRLLGYFLWPISFDSENYTISTRASDAWLRNKALIDADLNEDGFGQVPSPMYPPPKLLSPTKSKDTPSSVCGTSDMNIWQLFCSLVVIHVICNPLVPF